MHDDFPLGPTGEFPAGQLTPDDEGELRVAVGHDKKTGNVVIDFGSPVRWAALPPNAARGLAASLLGHAHAVDGLGPLIEIRKPETET